MESFDDRELRAILQEWKAPDAPPTLGSVLPKRRRWRYVASGFSRTTRWLLTGTIRVPVPVGLTAAVVLAMWIYSKVPSPPVTVPQAPPVTLADFQPVSRLEPRIVGEQ